ncbi:hypothetical protein ABZ915_31360 [Streptomyces sp. NPDC046915]|uniref:hypothetical protein n=1 Tax=Streptomyces sp. NPDC046915 TaxID=3155257 RepID=UPI0033DFBCA8
MVMIGPTGEMEDFVNTPLSGPMPPGVSHLAVPARAQISTVLVRVWNGAHPNIGSVVFDSSMELPDGALAVFDVDRVSRFVRHVGKSGVQHLTIRVDDPVRASRVDLVVNRGPDKASLNRVPGYDLPEIDGLSGELTPADALSLILAGTSLPEARLVTALDLVISEGNADDSPRCMRLKSYRLQRIMEWLKDAYPENRSEFWLDLFAFIQARVVRDSSPVGEAAAVSIAQSVIHQAEKFH